MSNIKFLLIKKNIVKTKKATSIVLAIIILLSIFFLTPMMLKAENPAPNQSLPVNVTKPLIDDFNNDSFKGDISKAGWVKASIGGNTSVDIVDTDNSKRTCWM